MSATMPASTTPLVHRPGTIRTGSGRASIVAGYLLATALCMVFLAAIPVGRPIWNSMYAEDGTIFYRQAVTGSWPAVLLHPYNGYLHIVPRLLSGVAALSPIGDAPLVFTGGSILVRALMAVFIFRASAGQLRGVGFRLLAAGAVLLVPAGETYDNAANLHWYLIAGAFWAVLWRPASRTGTAVAAAVAVAAVCSDPLTLALTPLIVLRLVSVRGWREHAVSIAFLAAAAVQLTAVANAPQTHRASAHWGQIPAIAAARVVIPFAIGRHLAISFAAAASDTGLVLLAVAILVVFLWPGLRSGGSARAVVLAVLLVDALVLTGAWRNAAGHLSVPMHDLRGNSRYAVTSMILLAGALAASLSGLRPGRARRVAYAFAVTGLVGYAMLFGQSLTSSQPGPLWSTQVAAARDRCAAGADPVEQLQIWPNWSVTLPCTLLDPSRPAVGVVGGWVGTPSRT